MAQSTLARAITGGLEGLAAATAGYAEAQAEVLKAKTAEQRHRALMNLENRKLDLQSQLIQSQERLTNAQRESTEQSEKADRELRLQLGQLSESGATNRVRLQTTSAERQAWISAQSELMAQQMVNEGLIQQAEMNNAAAFARAELETQTDKEIAELNNEAALQGIKEQVRGQIEAAKLKLPTAKPAAPSVTSAKPGETLIITDDKGNVLNQIPIPAGTNGTGKMTVTQSNFALFAARMEQSVPILENLEANSDFIELMTSSNNPLALIQRNAGRFRPDEFKQYEQAQRDFINAVLRKESGAVISDTEFENAEKQYFPQPGDDPGTIAQKQQLRRVVMNQFKKGAGQAVIDDSQGFQGPGLPEGKRARLEELFNATQQ